MANVNLRDLEHVRLGRDRHCFAIEEDLGLLAADTYLIPTDSYGRVGDYRQWAVGHDEHGRTSQLHDAAALLATRGFAWVDGAPAGSVLALNVAGGTTVNDLASMIRRLSGALDSLESRGLVSEFRARPLVAMPLIGSAAFRAFACPYGLGRLEGNAPSASTFGRQLYLETLS